MVLLVTLSCLAALLLLAVVAINVIRITGVLEGIGERPTSWLAKLRLGLRAIETETAQIEPQVTTLNSGLAAVDGGLRQVVTDLGASVRALRRGQS
ncbi:MAG TPA: hypothetical protein VK993_00850 [Chthoniobacterales bacterium]|nr:hypothetical protein [Chthoniobacterales bacterium]